MWRVYLFEFITVVTISIAWVTIINNYHKRNK